MTRLGGGGQRWSGGGRDSVVSAAVLHPSSDPPGPGNAFVGADTAGGAIGPARFAVQPPALLCRRSERSTIAFVLQPAHGARLRWRHSAAQPCQRRASARPRTRSRGHEPATITFVLSCAGELTIASATSDVRTAAIGAAINGQARHQPEAIGPARLRLVILYTCSLEKFAGSPPPAPHVGEARRLVLRAGVVHESLTGAVDCDMAADLRGTCGA
jgi:hypothetical protein